MSDFGKIKKIEKTLKKALIFPSKFVIITPVLFVKNGTMSLMKRLVLLQYNVVFNTNTVLKNKLPCFDGRDAQVTEQQEAYIIYDSILPEAMKKTARAKSLLAKGEAKNINEAVKMVGISRSVFYKYKDGIFPFYRQETNRVVTFSIKMNHKAGILMSVLNVLATSNCNISTINQDIPLSGMAVATITAEISECTMTLGTLLSSILKLDGVISAEIIGDIAG